jgi:hypothetical protein
MVSPYVPVALSMIGVISAFLSLATSWITITVTQKGKEIDTLSDFFKDGGFTSLTSEVGQELFGAPAVLGLLCVAITAHVGATGTGFFAAKSPESGKFWNVAIAEGVAAVCLAIAGVLWVANIRANFDLFELALEQVATQADASVQKFLETVEVEILFVSAGQGFGMTSFLFAVAAAITALMVHRANKNGSMQLQAWGPASDEAKLSWGGPVVAQPPYGQPQQQMQQMPQMPQMQMQQQNPQMQMQQQNPQWQTQMPQQQRPWA